MKRIFFDSFRYVTGGPKTHHAGKGRYWSALISGLDEEYQPVFSFKPPESAAMPKNPRMCLPPFPHLHPHKIGFSLENIYNSIVNSLKPFDILHPTFYNYLPLVDKLHKKGIPLVISAEDLLYERYPQPGGNELLTSGVKEKALKEAEAIISNSEFTKQEIVDFYKIDPNKIHVALENTDVIKPENPESYQRIQDPFFLVVGNRWGHKNFTLTLKAAKTVFSKYKDLKIVCVGHPFNEEEKQLIQEYKLEDNIIHLQYIEDDELANLYANSLALLYPSIYEGFGMPPLEAMRCGTVVVTSERCSMPEVAAEAAYYVDPFSVDSMIAAMEDLYNKPSLREELIKKGDAREKLFSWQRMIKVHEDVYKELLG